MPDMDKALPYAGWALLGAILVIWLVQKFLGKWIESAASALQERLIGRFATGSWLRRAALRRYVAALLEDYDKVPVPFIEHEDQRPSMRKIYVPLQTLDEDDRRLESDAYDSVRRARRSVVLGPPGSGKSMLLKSSMLIWAENTDRMMKNRRLWNRALSRSRSGKVPALVELRRCLPSDGIVGIRSLTVDQFADHGFAKADRFVDRALYDGDLTILFDGLDEVATVNRRAIVGLLTDFANRYPKCQMVVTCRTAIYQGQLSEKFADVVRVADFDDAQIRQFMHNWQRSPADPVADQLLEVLRNVPRLMQLARNPLLLTLIAYLYAYRGKEAMLPRSRAQFYKEATDLLLRNKPEFDYSQSTKMAVLQRLALVAQDTPAANTDRQVLPYAKVIETVKEILPATVLHENDVQPLLDEIVTRSGIIKQIRGEQSFHFAHLTLQEYLAAAELADRPDDLIQRYRSDPAIWRETIKLWCGYVNRDSKLVVSEVFDLDPVLAFECLADAVQVDEALAKKVTEYHEERLGYSGADDAVVQAFGAVASDHGPRGQAVLSFLAEMARTPDDPRRTSAIRALAATRLPRAADILAELYPEPAARDSLRTMGDLAVAAYASHARKGLLTAIDDLASIATPAAARELISLLAADTDTSTRAAWHIAALVRSPDVEETLQRSDDLLPPSGPRLDAVWAPFQEQSTKVWLDIIGRVAYLLDNSPDGVVPDLVNVDRRIAIPLCCVQIDNLMKGSPFLVVRPEFKQSIENPERSKTGLPYSHHVALFDSGGKLQIERYELGRIVRDLPEDTARPLVRSILVDAGVRKAHQSLFAELTLKLQLQFFARACSGLRRPVNLSDWLDSFTPRKNFRILESMARILTGIAAAGIIGLAIYSIVEVFLGSWTWGPAWLEWVPIGIVAYFVIAGILLGDRLEDLTSSKFMENVNMLALFLLIGLALFYGALALREHWGWSRAVSTFVVTTVALSLLWWIISARRRTVANPMRGLLEIDDQATRNRTSIVA